MPRDSQLSYLHFTQSHYALYTADWVRDKLPNDPIEAPAIHQMNYDDDNEHTSIQHSFGAIKSKTKKDPVWKDHQLDKVMSDDPTWWAAVKDTSLLNRVERVEGVGSPTPPPSSAQVSGLDPKRGEVTTPEMMRSRPTAQRSVSNSFQTPIGRIVR